MAFLGVHVKSNARVVAKGMQDLGAEIPKVGRKQIFLVAKRSRTRLKKPGKKVTYPIPWDNPKQKIRVIAMLRILKNLPYRRTGEYQDAFDIKKTREGYNIVHDWNPQPLYPGGPRGKTQYIGGDAKGKGQSRIFKGRYPIIREVVDEEVEKLPSAVVAHIKIVTAQKGLHSS